jgi:hypothetical protein
MAEGHSPDGPSQTLKAMSPSTFARWAQPNFEKIKLLAKPFGHVQQILRRKVTGDKQTSPLAAHSIPLIQ